MNLKSLVAMMGMIAGLGLYPFSADAQIPQVNKPAGDPPQLVVNSLEWGGSFNLLLGNCDQNNNANDCFGVGKNYVLAAGGFEAFKGTQEKIVAELNKIAEQELAAITSLKAEGINDSETIAQMQNWASQAQTLADSIHTSEQTRNIDAQWGLWFLDRGCKFGSNKACANLMVALIYRDGKSMVPTGTQELEKLCAKEVGSACGYLGDFHLKGEYFPKSVETAAKYYELGCGAKERNLEACRAIAMMYETGEGVPKDPAKAKEIYRYICMRDGTHCNDVSRLKKVVGDTQDPIFDLGKKLFPEIYNDLKKTLTSP